MKSLRTCLVVVSFTVAPYGWLVGCGSENSQNAPGLVNPGTEDATTGADGTTSPPSSSNEAGSDKDAASNDEDAAGRDNDAASNDKEDGGDGTPGGFGLDPTFNGGIIQSTAIRQGSDQVYSVLRQTDGKLVIVGTNGANGAPFVARLLADGSLDPAFGSAGIVLLAGGRSAPDGFVDAETWGAALQPDGKIIVADGHDGIYADGIITRLDASGAHDPSFGTDGRLRISRFVPRGLAVASNGAIYLGGAGTGVGAGIMRLTTAGAVDVGFGTNGLVTTPEGPRDLLLDGTGRIVVVVGTATGIAVRRFSAGGAPDTSFNGTGMLQTNLSWFIGNGGHWYRSVAVQSDDKILVGGANGGASVLLRFDANGAPDATFDGDGKATVGTSTIAPESVTVAADGTITVVAMPSNLPSAEMRLYRLTAAGAPLATFASGAMTPGFLAHTAVAAADGSILFGGAAKFDSEGLRQGVVGRVSAEGTLDASFGSAGVRRFSTGASWDQVRALAIQPDGKILAAGVGAQGEDREGWAVARYTSSGALDTGFGNSGRVVSAGTNRLTSPRATGVFVDGSNRVVVAGGGIGTTHFRASRFSANGSIDTTYGNGGTVQFEIGSAVLSHASTMDANGRVLFAGVAAIGGKTRFAVARLTANGAPDTTFNGTGYVVTEVGDPTVVRSGAFSLAVQGDGKIVVAGSAFVSADPSYRLAILRYETGGALDTSFDGDGIALVDAISGPDHWVEIPRAVAIQADGKIVLTGVAGYLAGGLPTDGEEFWTLRRPTSDGDTKLLVVRLTTNGGRDATFGQEGVFASTLGSLTTVGQAIRPLADGRMWIGGELEDATKMKRGFLARLTGAGTLDATFGTGGVAKLPAEIGGPSAIRALAIQGDGKLVAGGEVYRTPTGSDFALLRLP